MKTKKGNAANIALDNLEHRSIMSNLIPKQISIPLQLLRV